MMELRSLVRDYPDSRYGQMSLFALGEYYYDRMVYNEAVKRFRKYIERYPDSKVVVFARAYVLKIKKLIMDPSKKNKESIENIELEFFSGPLFLLFSEYKEFSYKSTFQNEFTVRYYIDIVEVYKNGDLFVKITK